MGRYRVIQIGFWVCLLGVPMMAGAQSYPEPATCTPADFSNLVTPYKGNCVVTTALPTPKPGVRSQHPAPTCYDASGSPKAAMSSYRNCEPSSASPAVDCAKVDANPMNSCAFKKEAALAPNYSSVAATISTRTGNTNAAVSAWVTDFGNSLCGGKRVFGCVSADDGVPAKKIHVSSTVIAHKNGTSLKALMAEVRGEAKKSTVPASLTTAITGSISAINASATSANSNFNNSGNTDLASPRWYCPGSDLTSAKVLALIQSDKFKASGSEVTIKVDDANTHGGIRAWEKEKSWKECVSSFHGNFNPNDASGISSTTLENDASLKPCIDLVKNDSATYKLRVDSITASSSALNNTGDAARDFCKKGFLDLSRARAQGVLAKIKAISGIGSVEHAAGVLNYAGANGDGTRGDCPYEKNSHTGGIFKEQQRAVPAGFANWQAALNKHQRVDVKITVIHRHAEEFRESPTITTYRGCYRVSLGCWWEPKCSGADGAAFW